MATSDAGTVLRFLGETRTRATYGAVGDVIGCVAKGVGAKLGERRPEASWVVNTETGLPTGYKPEEMHPALREREEIVDDGEELGRRLREWLVKEAIRVAVAAHGGQVQRNGEAYVLHPLELMMRMETPEERMTAVLHDVIEDTAMTAEGLREAGIPAEVVEAVERLTRRKGDDYDEYLKGVRANPLARRVKLADIAHNLDIRRLPGRLRDKDLERLRKYHGAWGFLNGEA